jgi:hypothetical protein
LKTRLAPTSQEMMLYTNVILAQEQRDPFNKNWLNIDEIHERLLDREQTIRNSLLDPNMPYGYAEIVMLRNQLETQPTDKKLRQRLNNIYVGLWGQS